LEFLFSIEELKVPEVHWTSSS